jgi:DNA polymerase-3 subunit beta
MTFSVSSTELLRKLQLAGGAIGTNVVMPILEDYHFTLEGNTLIIKASDLETTIITEVEVTGSESGVIAVPAKILTETLKSLPQQPITFRADIDTYGIEITSSTGKYKMAGEDASDFPKTPDAFEVDEISIPAKSLINGIGKTLFATSNDELRPAMSGVLFQLDFDKIVMVATDAHKLVKYTYHQIKSEIVSQFIVPKKVLAQLKGSLKSGNDIRIAFNKSNAFFVSDGVQMICRLIDSRYPDYNAVIPVDNPNRMIVNRADLHSSLKRIAFYANQTTNQVTFTIADGSLTINAQDKDFSNEATEQLTCTYEGDPMQISFNAKFLAEMLNVLTVEEISMEMSTPNRAGILKPGTTEEEEDILMLVMPVMLSVSA